MSNHANTNPGINTAPKIGQQPTAHSELYEPISDDHLRMALDVLRVIAECYPAGCNPHRVLLEAISRVPALESHSPPSLNERYYEAQAWTTCRNAGAFMVFKPAIAARAFIAGALEALSQIEDAQAETIATE